MKKIVKNKKILLLLLLVVTFFIGCKKKSETISMHLNYFGLTPGKYVIYNVKEMKHDETVGQHDTLIYQLKTYIGQQYIDNQGRTAREFYRYTRSTNLDSWVLKDLWTIIIAQYKAEIVEENQRIIKLVFSPTIDKKWNPNAFNTNDPLEYSYSNIHKPLVFNGVTFDSTLVVEQGSFKSLIDFQTMHEVYATNVGLVSKVYKNLKIADFDTLNVKKGTEIYYNFVEHGFE